MTEAEWLACEEPTPMLVSLANKGSNRKLRLFAIACVRNLHHEIGEYCGYAVAAAEQFADDLTTSDHLSVAYELADEEAHNSPDYMEAHLAYLAAASVAHSTAIDAAMQAWLDAAGSNARSYPPPHHTYEEYQTKISEQERREARRFTFFVRDIFGNPFRPVSFNPAWRTDTAVSLARGMYDSREFGAMPILADALQDAGCEDEQILTHCRDANQPHVRGCWVCDLVLGL